MAELRAVVDTLITIPNQRLLAVVGRGTPLLEAFKVAEPCCCRPCRASPT